MAGLRKLLVTGAVAMALVAGATAAPVGAGIEFAFLEGEFDCNPDGTGTITWTITSNTQGDLAVASALMSIDGGTPVPPTFSPDPIPGFEVSLATVDTDGRSSGTAVAEVVVDTGEPLIELTEEVTLTPCEQPLEPTSTTASPSTTASTTAPAAAPATATRAQPAFTG